MALTESKNYVHVDGNREHYPVANGQTIFKGAAVTINSSGFLTNLATNGKFAGFALEDAVGNASNSVQCQVLRKGAYWLPVTGATITSNQGTLVYASDNNTFTTTASTNLLMGAVRKFNSAAEVLVEFDAFDRHIDLDVS
jgi:hypothetical protein